MPGMLEINIWSDFISFFGIYLLNCLVDVWILLFFKNNILDFFVRSHDLDLLVIFYGFDPMGFITISHHHLGEYVLVH